MLNRQSFSVGFTGLCEVYNRKPSETLTLTYYEVLKTMTDDDFTRAVSTILETRRFTNLPTPAEILQAITGDASDRALLAFEKVVYARKNIGHYRTVAFDDPVIHAVIDYLGGWVAICEMAAEDWRFARKDFVEFYKAKGKVGANKGRYGLLVGYEGETKRFMAVGDKAKIRAMLETVKLIEDKKETTS